MILYNKWSLKSENIHFEALKTPKLLSSGGSTWAQLGVCTWILPGGSQFPLHPSDIGNPLPRIGARRPKQFYRIVPEHSEKLLSTTKMHQPFPLV